MKKYNYSRLVNASKRLIDKFGGDITFVVMITTPSANAWEPPTVVETRIPATGIFVKQEEKYERGVLVQEASQKVLFYKLDTAFDPKLTGYIERGSESWKFSKIKQVNPAGTVVLYSAEIVQ